MEELLLRNYSSVHVHYIPLAGFGQLGTSDIIMKQNQRLAARIRGDAKLVQEWRAETWRLLDAIQMKIVIDNAFKHLASGSEEPFDFNQCRKQVSPPLSTEEHLAEFLGRCLHNKVEDNFDAVAQVVGSCLVRQSLRCDKSGKLIMLVRFGRVSRRTNSLKTCLVLRQRSTKNSCKFVLGL